MGSFGHEIADHTVKDKEEPEAEASVPKMKRVIILRLLPLRNSTLALG